MSIDERARTAARRTSASMVAASDVAAAYGDLVAMRRRRARAKVVALSAVVVAVLIVVVAGVNGPTHRRIEPVAPKPGDSKPFRAAPPFCGPSSFGESLSAYVEVGGVCPTGPGRYLSVEMGYGTSPPFAFTLPAHWTIRPIGAVGGGDVIPALGGLMLQSGVTGDAVVLTEYPTEVTASGHVVDTESDSPLQVARRLAASSVVQPTAVVAAKLNGYAFWRVDLLARPDAAMSGLCLVGPRCAVTFALGRDEYPGRSHLGLVPGVPSTALVGSGSTHIPIVAWTWGDPDTDQELGGVLASIDLDPPVICEFDALPCAN